MNTIRVFPIQSVIAQLYRLALDVEVFRTQSELSRKSVREKAYDRFQDINKSICSVSKLISIAVNKNKVKYR